MADTNFDNEDAEIWKNLERLKVQDYSRLDSMIIEHPKLTLKEYVEIIDYHKFTEESLKYLINQINKNRLTFNGIGPYGETDGRYYYAGKVKREQRIRLIHKLKDEISVLRVENKKLRNESD
tara:strand:- start:137 stop:502 length:366 start_codon:yes stop_codon:yes gene_type:complete